MGNKPICCGLGQKLLQLCLVLFMANKRKVDAALKGFILIIGVDVVIAGDNRVDQLLNPGVYRGKCLHPPDPARLFIIALIGRSAFGKRPQLVSRRGCRSGGYCCVRDRCGKGQRGAWFRHADRLCRCRGSPRRRGDHRRQGLRL